MDGVTKVRLTKKKKKKKKRKVAKFVCIVTSEALEPIKVN
jgi:hypothetical protein